MAEDFGTMDQSVLIDKLAEYTSKYMQFLTNGGMQKEIDDCKKTIEQLQHEIEKRQQQGSTSAADPARYHERVRSKNRGPL